MKVGEYILTAEDKRILHLTSEWLTDSIINASQYILHIQFPRVKGLQNCLLAEVGELEPMNDRFVQVLSLNLNHWVTISNMLSEEPLREMRI